MASRVDNSDIEKLFRVVAADRYRRAKADGLPITSEEDLISAEERDQVYRWADGTELDPLTKMPGYEILIGKLQGYVDDAIKEWLTTNPTDKDAVLAVHAKSFASHMIYQRLLADVAADVEAAKEYPNIVKEGIRLTRGIPAESA